MAGKVAHAAAAMLQDHRTSCWQLVHFCQITAHTTEGWSSKSEGQAVHAPTTVRSQETSQWQRACLLEEHCISYRMVLHAQQLQAAVRV